MWLVNINISESQKGLITQTADGVKYRFTTFYFSEMVFIYLWVSGLWPCIIHSWIIVIKSLKDNEKSLTVMIGLLLIQLVESKNILWCAVLKQLH